MNVTGYKFISAAVAALLYVVLAASLVRAERKTKAGGFITLPGMASYLVAFPVALPMEFAGHKIDFRSNWQMGVASLAEFIWFSTIGSP